MMTLAYTNQLGFWTPKTVVGASKIDWSLLKTFKIVIVGFQVIGKLGQIQLF